MRSRRRPRDDAADLGLAYADLLSPLLTVTGDDLRAGLRLLRGTRGLGPFDAVLAAAALATHCQALVSADAAFAGVPGLRHVVPDEQSLAGLLGP